jgi:quercetin dioxygenase-like cupin family protein
MPAIYFSSTAEQIVFDNDGPRPQVLVDCEKLKVIVAGLEPGQQFPPHPETLAVYHLLSGKGAMTVNGTDFPVHAGATVIAPPGATRGMHARSRLTFLAAKSGA